MVYFAVCEFHLSKNTLKKKRFTCALSDDDDDVDDDVDNIDEGRNPRG